MQQRLRIIEKLVGTSLNSEGVPIKTVTYIAETLHSNGVNMHLQINITDTEKKGHLHKHFMKSYLGSKDGDLAVGSIIQLELQHRYQRNKSPT